LAAGHRTSGKLKDFFLFFLSGESDPTSAFTLWIGGLQEQLTNKIDWELHRKLHDAKAAGATTFFFACSFDFSEVIRNMVARQIVLADYINNNGLSALEVAVNHGSCEVIQS
jgi:ankyrin repeat protein